MRVYNRSTFQRFTRSQIHQGQGRDKREQCLLNLSTTVKPSHLPGSALQYSRKLSNAQDLHDWKPSTATVLHTGVTQSFRTHTTDTQNTKTVILPPNSTSVLSSSIRDTITQNHERNVHSLLEMPIGNWSKQDVDEANQEFYNIIKHRNINGAKQATKILHRIVDEFIEGNPYASLHISMIDEVRMIIYFLDFFIERNISNSFRFYLGRQSNRTNSNQNFISFLLVSIYLDKCISKASSNTISNVNK